MAQYETEQQPSLRFASYILRCRPKAVRGYREARRLGYL